MKKSVVVEKVIAALDEQLAVYARSARSAHEEATHEQSKAENKYDTRGLEASYLAHGQSRLVAEVEEARQQFAALPLREWKEGEGIDLGALVALEQGRERSLYLIGPAAGGTEVETEEGESVMVITPHSPLGKAILGRKEGERFSLEIARSKVDYRVAAVS